LKKFLTQRRRVRRGKEGFSFSASSASPRDDILHSFLLIRYRWCRLLSEHQTIRVSGRAVTVFYFLLLPCLHSIWYIIYPEVTLLLSGMNDMRQLDENIQIAETAEPNMFSQEEIETFQDVKKIFNDSFKIHCTGCHYCMPCPHGVNIPVCFSAYDTYHAISKSTGSLQYSMSIMNSGYAGLCKKCGLCEKHCPQHIPIVSSLAEVKKTMENYRFKIMRFVMKLFIKKK